MLVLNIPSVVGERLRIIKEFIVLGSTIMPMDKTPWVSLVGETLNVFMKSDVMGPSVV